MVYVFLSAVIKDAKTGTNEPHLVLLGAASTTGTTFRNVTFLVLFYILHAIHT